VGTPGPGGTVFWQAMNCLLRTRRALTYELPPGVAYPVSYVVVTGAALLLVAVYATGVVTVGQGKPVFIYNLLDLKRTTWAGPKLGAGKHTIVFAFTSDGPGLGNGGTGVLSVDGKEVARNSMGHSTPITFPEDESFDVGNGTRTGVAPVKYRYEVPFPFTGHIDNLTFNLEPVQEAEADVKHLPAPDASAIGTED